MKRAAAPSRRRSGSRDSLDAPIDGRRIPELPVAVLVAARQKL
jgi:hypothetical protein